MCIDNVEKNQLELAIELWFESLNFYKKPLNLTG
jgi:hypothetical protein